eukprot:TRINITY_DN263_c0_g1_i1.p1 TRINITY_DN263_c0_g1~~TRINITY_DN263_c0_g1_i1.p1  ORF type:complete len:111 (-),score=48.20 TRINITY_DN263_c0_g1_i1:209-541(-)
MADTVTVLKTKTKCELCKVQPGKYSVSRETRDELGTVSETNVGGSDMYMVVCAKCLHDPPTQDDKLAEKAIEDAEAESESESEEKEEKPKKKSKSKKEKKKKKSKKSKKD